MAENLRKLILEQANATSDMKKILINYKKLAKANITLVKTNARLAELQALWKEIRYRHNDITFVERRKIRRSCPTSLKTDTKQRRTPTIKLPIISTRPSATLRPHRAPLAIPVPI
ncbi:hypothetical protein HN011_008198, partial [Eciton burchellii]